MAKKRTGDRGFPPRGISADILKGQGKFSQLSAMEKDALKRAGTPLGTKIPAQPADRIRVVDVEK